MTPCQSASGVQCSLRGGLCSKGYIAGPCAQLGHAWASCPESAPGLCLACCTCVARTAWLQALTQASTSVGHQSIQTHNVRLADCAKSGEPYKPHIAKVVGYLGSLLPQKGPFVQVRNKMQSTFYQVNLGTASTIVTWIQSCPQWLLLHSQNVCARRLCHGNFDL